MDITRLYLNALSHIRSILYIVREADDENYDKIYTCTQKKVAKTQHNVKRQSDK